MTRNYKLLGGVEISDDGQPAAIMKYSKGCALLTYLIVSEEIHSREAAADLLWEATSTDQSLRNLRATLHKIKPLAPELVVQRKQLYFQSDETVVVDYLQLKAGLANRDIERVDKALALYKGDLLDEFYLDDAPRFWEWLLLARERLRRWVWDGYHRVCTAYEENRQYQQGVEAARRWLMLDLLDENIHQWLMKFLAANGQKTAALEQYEICKAVLDQELGLEPEPATRALYEKIQQLPDEISVVPPALELPEPGELAEPGALPSHSYLPYHRNPAFTGRIDDLLHLAEQLLPAEQQIVGRLTRALAVTGMGGLGKSQLAVEYAYRYGRYYPGGVYWLNFAEQEQINELAAALGGERGMGLFSEKDRLPLGKKIELVKRAWQEQIPRLLIFDNCEDIHIAAEWLPVSGGCSVLLTSRFSDWSKTLPLAVYPLEILPRPESKTFLQYLAERLSDDEADRVAHEVGDWPLALHLAGSFLYRYQDVLPEAYLVQLQEERLLGHASLQGRYARYSPTGHELNVARTFAVSFERLDMADEVDTAARRLLAQAAQLAPNEPIPLALLINPVSTEDRSDEILQAAINRLLNLGFLSQVEDNIVIMHHLLVTFAVDRLAGESVLGEGKTVSEQSLIQQLNIHQETGESLASLPFSPTHLRFVANRALETEDETAVQFANLMGNHLLAIANYDEARDYLEDARQRTVNSYGENSLEMGRVATLLGNLFQAKGQYKEAEPYYQQALAIHEDRLGELHLETANSLNNMAASRLRIGPYQTAEPYFERALAIRERLLGPDHPLTLGVLNNMGVMHNFMGNTDRARLHFEKVLAIRERTLGPEHLLTATSLNNLGDLLARNGEEAAGRPYLERASAVREKLLGPDHPLTLACKTNLGLLLGRLGEYGQAIEQLEQARQAALPKLGESHPLTARILNTLGVLFTQTGRFDEAIPCLEQALTIRERVRGPMHPDTSYSLMCLGELYLARQETDKGRSFFERAMAILEKTVEPSAPEYLRIQSYLAEMPK